MAQVYAGRAGSRGDARYDVAPRLRPRKSLRADSIVALEQGRLASDGLGRWRSPLSGDVYKSATGALGEAAAVFVAGARLRERWAGRQAFTILELGFGLGANFLATLAAWRADPQRPARLDFVSVEAHPLEPADLARALAGIGADPGDADALLAGWPLPLPGLHQLALAGGQVVLTLALGEAGHIVPRLAVAADAFFLDGFSPPRNPEMWAPALMKQLGRRARPGASLASYSVAASVRDALRAAGFETWTEPGFGNKRSRLAGRYAPAWRTWPPPPEPPCLAPRRVLVVGAGIGGAAVARGFADAGWSVHLAEALASPAGGGSDQPRLAMHLHLSPDDNHLSRLTRAALGMSPGAGLLARPVEPATGRISPAAGPAAADRQQALLDRLDTAPEFARRLDAGEASDLAGVTLRHGGIWTPRADSVAPRATCARWLAHDAIRTDCGQRVRALERGEAGWIAHADAGPIGSFPLVVLACPEAALRLAAVSSITLRHTRGQTTRLYSPALAGLRCVLSGDAYACPLPGGETLVGSTYGEDDALAPRDADDLSNMRRLARMLDVPCEALSMQGRGAATGLRFATRDRLPLLGWAPDDAAAAAAREDLLRNARLPLPRAEGLMLATGFGSRGALWSLLAARLLPALAEGRPLPVEADLAAAVDPLRFLRRALASGTLH